MFQWRRWLRPEVLSWEIERKITHEKHAARGVRRTAAWAVAQDHKVFMNRTDIGHVESQT